MTGERAGGGGGAGPPPLTPALRAFVERARRAHLATASAAALPHVVPVCFALLDPATVVFAIDDKPKAAGRTLKRVRNLAANPAFALVVDAWDEDWGKLGYVLLTGRGAVLRDPARHAAAIVALRARYPQYVAMDLDAGRHEVVALTIEHAHAWGRLERERRAARSAASGLVALRLLRGSGAPRGEPIADRLLVALRGRLVPAAAAQLVG